MKKILETERLILREFVKQDDKAILEILADGGMPHLPQFGPLDINYSCNFLNRFIESYKNNGFGLWAIIEKKTENLIGYCGLHRIKINDTEDKVELAYRIYKKLWGNGYAPEVAKAILDYAFNILNLKEIISCIAPDNQKSSRVAEKVGLTYWKDATFRGLNHKIYKKEK